MTTPPLDRLNAAVQRLEAALDARVKSESSLRARAETAEGELAKLKADYAALSGLADQVETRLDKAIEKLKAGA
jgi:predicted  nucleic acid-binding Zn-ribbon protein